MLDANLNFGTAQALAAGSTFSTNTVQVNKTPPDGMWVEVLVITNTLATSLQFTAYTKDVDSAWAVTDRVAGIGQATLGPSATGRFFFRVQSKNKYMKLLYVGVGAGAASVTAQISSGPQQDAVV
jgi:hypothetical protein